MYDEKEIRNMIYLYVFSLSLIIIERSLETSMTDKNNWLANTFNKSVIDYKSDYTELFTQQRGKSYFLPNGENLTITSDDMKHCICTSWSVSHFIFYIIVGYFCPSLFWVTLLIGIGFEIIEYYTFDCHDVLDIIYNSSGFGLGYLIRKIMSI